MNTLSVAKVRAGLSAAVLAVATIAAAPLAQAQQSVVRAQIPFGFENGSQHLAAGQYTVSLQADHIMVLQSNKAGGLVMTLPDENMKPAATSRIVFRKYGDKYFLREVWIAGRTTHVHCVKSREEKSLQVAQNEVPPTAIEVALLEPAH